MKKKKIKPSVFADYNRLLKNISYGKFSSSPLYDKLVKQNPCEHKIGSTLRIKLPQDYKMSKLTELSDKEKFERNQRMECIVQACCLIGRTSISDNPAILAKELYKFVKKG